VVVAEVTQRRTQEERRQASEEALLTAASELIAEGGIAYASMGRIGERAGLSSGLALHYFRSKEVLVTRAAERSKEWLRQAVDDELARRHQTRSQLTGLEHIRLTVETYLRIFEDPSAVEQALLVMWGATFPTTASIEGMRRATSDTFAGWLELIRAGQADGSIRSDVGPEDVSILLLGLTRGVAALLVADGDLTSMGGLRATCDRLIVDAIATKCDHVETT
jgi:AcrR family transcriptional regulator